MHEEVLPGTDGVLDASPSASQPGDPMKALMAIAGPRGELYRDDRRQDAPSASDGVTVETRVSFDSGQAQGQTDETDYEPFALPEGFEADPEALSRFKPLAKRLGLGQEAAQELAGLYVELEQRRNAANAEFVERNNAEWAREVEHHPEFGGPRLRETRERVAGILRRYGSPVLMEQIRRMNVQNWPEMFYFLARTAQGSSEDNSPSGYEGGHDNQSAARILFPDFK